jgi:hypothetical protein
MKIQIPCCGQNIPEIEETILFESSKFNVRNSNAFRLIICILMLILIGWLNIFLFSLKNKNNILIFILLSVFALIFLYFLFVHQIIYIKYSESYKKVLITYEVNLYLCNMYLTHYLDIYDITLFTVLENNYFIRKYINYEENRIYVHPEGPTNYPTGGNKKFYINYFMIMDDISEQQYNYLSDLMLNHCMARRSDRTSRESDSSQSVGEIV